MSTRIRQTVAIILLFALTCGAAHAGQPGPNSPLSGVWQITIMPDPATGLPSIENFATITRDGKIVNVDPDFGAGVGDSYRLGPKQFAVGFYGFVEMGGTTFTYEVQATVTRADSGQFGGPYRTLIRDPSGTVVNELTGTIEANRLPVQPF